MALEDKAVWTVEDVAAFLDVTPDTVRDQARHGLLPARKVGKEWRISRRAVMEWLEGLDPEGRLRRKIGQPFAKD